MRDKWDYCSLSSMIDFYNSDSQYKPSFHEIETRIMELGYTYPVLYFGLDEEDAGEFMLYLHSSIPSIIGNFDHNLGEFEAYFYGIVRQQVKAFYKRRSTEERHERALLKAHAYDMSNGIYLNEKSYSFTNNAAQTLIFVFKHSKACRRRFFVLLAELTPFMSVDDISAICDSFDIDLLETLFVTDRVASLCNDSIAVLNELRSKQAMLFSSYLLHLEDQDKDGADKNLKWLMKRNSELSSIQKKAGHNCLSKVFKLNSGTISNYLFYSRRMLQWISDPYSNNWTAKDLSIRSDLFNFVSSGGHSKKPVEKTMQKTFRPIKEFNLEDK